jgi:AAA domain
MRIDQVLAKAFGPLRDQTLVLAPGMNVIFGPNEAGKSSWHAALATGLCGRRRSRGQTTEARRFEARHRPWTGGTWRVGAMITLEDGRMMELSHELDAAIDCSARDMVLGSDVSNEIMFDGAPDGSRWLGLDRRAFLATACVGQAELASIADDPQLLQTHIQRAVAGRSTDPTANRALDILREFRREHVGVDQANSIKPLRRAKDRLRTAQSRLERAREEHRAFLGKEAAVAAARLRAELALASVERLKAALHEERYRVLARNVERTEEILARVPERPVDPTDPDRLEAARGAVAKWEAAPAMPSLEGRSVAQLEAELAILADVGDGDLTEAPAIVERAQRLREAELRIGSHEAVRPADRDPLRDDTTPDELHRLAAVLREEEPPVPDAATGGDLASSRALGRRRALGYAVAVGSMILAGGLALFVSPMLADQRRGGTRSADHPGGVPEARFRALPHPQVHRPQAGPGPVPDLLQHRPGPYRTVDERPDSRAGSWQGEDMVSLKSMRRQNSETGQPRRRSAFLHTT